jgi:hypothetical protein
MPLDVSEAWEGWAQEQADDPFPDRELGRTGVCRWTRSRALRPVYLDARPRFRVEDGESLLEQGRTR